MGNVVFVIRVILLLHTMLHNNTYIDKLPGLRNPCHIKYGAARHVGLYNPYAKTAPHSTHKDKRPARGSTPKPMAAR